MFEVLNKVCKAADIQIEYSWTPMYNSYYIEGINHLYEFDCGSQSGWMYKVNDWFPNYGCSTYKVENGDIVLFHNDSNDIVNALPTVIQHYQGLGFTIIPVGQIVLDGDYTIDVQGKQHPVQTTQPTQEPQQT